MALQRELADRLPEMAAVSLAGSGLSPEQLDPWSDLDLHLDLAGRAEPVDLFVGLDIWAVSDDVASGQQVLRVVHGDGRWVDLVVEGGRVSVPAQSADNDIRMIAALAAAKLGRGELLISLHLTLELMRACLVQAMLLRDRDVGTTTHRFGSERDATADRLVELLQRPLGATPRPNIIEHVVYLYGRLRSELDPLYEPDWSGLESLLDRGLEVR
jgi:hypothetical protein